MEQPGLNVMNNLPRVRYHCLEDRMTPRIRRRAGIMVTSRIAVSICNKYNFRHYSRPHQWVIIGPNTS